MRTPRSRARSSAPARGFVEDDIRRLDVDGAAGTGDGQEIEQLDAARAAGRIASDHDRSRAAWRPGRFGIQHRRRSAPGLEPVLVERRLQRAHRRPGDLELRVPPMIRFVGAALPVIGDADAAREGHVAVGHQNLAVRAVVGFFDGPRPQRVEPDERHAGRLQLIARLARQPAAERVEDQADGDASARGVGQLAREAVGDVAVLVDETFQADALAGLANRVEHRRERFVAVSQRRVVASVDRCAHERCHVVRKPRVCGGNGTLHSQRFLILRNQQQDGDRDDPDEGPQFPPANRSPHQWMSGCNRRSTAGSIREKTHSRRRSSAG